MRKPRRLAALKTEPDPTEKKKCRYPNVKKSRLFGHTFDSKREAKRYLVLRDRLQCGEIVDLDLQPRIKIILGGVKVRYYPSKRQMVYVADFRYTEVATGELIIEDVKMQSRFRPEIYRIKRALIHSMGLKINEV